MFIAKAIFIEYNEELMKQLEENVPHHISEWSDDYYNVEYRVDLNECGIKEKVFSLIKEDYKISFEEFKNFDYLILYK
ncbi:hypothetical protein [Caminibacter sp.]